MAGAGAEVEIHWHTLPGAGRSVVEREIIDLAARFPHTPVPNFVGNAVRFVAFLAVRLANAQGERALAILAVVVVSEIGLDFARKEEFVGRRQNAQRSSARFEDRQPVASANPNRVAIHGSAEAVLLPRPGQDRATPRASGSERETFQPADVLVSHRRLVGLGDHLLAQQVRSAIHGEQQAPLENTQVDAIERDLQASSFRGHLASAGMKAGPGAADFPGRARQIHVCAGASGHHQRRVPEGIPLFPIHHFGRKRDAQLAQRRHLLFGEAALAAGHLEFRSQIAA